MSRKVDLSKPLSEEDRAYLLSRYRYTEVRKNDRQFGRQGVEVTPTAGVPSNPANYPEGSGSVQAEPAPESGEPEGSGAVEDSQVPPVSETSQDSTAPQQGNSPEDIEWVNGLTVDELKDELRDRGEPVSGSKVELQQRLLAVLQREDEQQ